MSEASNQNYYKSDIIAQLFGVSVRRIQQLTEEGVIAPIVVTEDGRKVRKYELVETVQKYTRYLKDKAEGKASSERELELKEKKMQAEIALKESQGELHRLKTDIAAGKYIDLEEVKLDYGRFFIVFKKFATSLPSRVTGLISAHVEPTKAREIEKDLNAEVNRLLESFVVAGVTPEEIEATRRGKKSV